MSRNGTPVPVQTVAGSSSSVGFSSGKRIYQIQTDIFWDFGNFAL